MQTKTNNIRLLQNKFNVLDYSTVCFDLSEKRISSLFILYLCFYFARKTLKDIYKHTYSVIHKIIHTFTVNKIAIQQIKSEISYKMLNSLRTQNRVNHCHAYTTFCFLAAGASSRCLSWKSSVFFLLSGMVLGRHSEDTEGIMLEGKLAQKLCVVSSISIPFPISR